jgi:hypothetical protein
MAQEDKLNLSEKRETDLINLKIIGQTEKVFPEEIIILRATTNFMRRLTKVANQALPYFDQQPSLRAVMELFCRNRELTHFSIVCIVNAGYSETKILSRVAIENFMLMRLFSAMPDVAHTWFSDPEKFRKDWTPKKIRQTVFSKVPKRATSYDAFYWLLCDYSHPSFKGWYEIFKRQNERVLIGARPEFNAEYSSECIGLVSFVSLQSVKIYVDFFKAFFDENMLNEINSLMPKLFEIVTRHFEVRTYHKETLLEKKS